MKIFHQETDNAACFNGAVGWLLFFTLWERMCRKQYAVERESPEQFDLGGEA